MCVINHLLSLVRSGVKSNFQSTPNFPPFTSDLYSRPHLLSSTTHLSPPPPPPPLLTTDWTHNITSRPSKWTTALPCFNHTSATISGKKSKKSKRNSDSKRWKLSDRLGDSGVGVCGEERGEEVGESVSSIMESLMKTPVVPVRGDGGGGEGGKKRETRGHQDPRVVMDMRHKQVCM